MDNSSIGKNLNFYRNENKLSQNYMAEMLGVDRSTYLKMEMGKTNLINRRLKRAAEILGIPVERLLLDRGMDVVSGEELEERENLREQLAEMRRFYEDKVENLIKELRILKEMNESQAATIRSQFDIIERFQRQK